MRDITLTEQYQIRHPGSFVSHLGYPVNYFDISEYNGPSEMHNINYSIAHAAKKVHVTNVFRRIY